MIAQALTADDLIEPGQSSTGATKGSTSVSASGGFPDTPNVKEELPSARTVEVAPADIIFQESSTSSPEGGHLDPACRR